MAMTNAEKQAAWRRRRDERIRLLQAELDQLRNQPKPEPQLARPAPRPAGDALNAARKLIEEIQARRDLDADGKRLAKAALAEITKEQLRHVTGLRRIDAKIALLAGYDSAKVEAVRHKVQALVDRGATDGERAAAAAALKRLPNPDVERVAPRPEPLPRTQEEMLARRR